MMGARFGWGSSRKSSSMNRLTRQAWLAESKTMKTRTYAIDQVDLEEVGRWRLLLR